MKWNEVELLVSPEATDLVALLLYECGSNGSIIHDEVTDELGRIRITAYFPSSQEDAVETVTQNMKLLASRDDTLGSWSLIQEDADDADWLDAWQKYFHPVKMSPHFWAAPAWENAVPAEGEDVIRIEPGMAFGSGVHDTTCMCVQFLEECVQPGDVVLDVGTGTGILAVAAAKLGAAAVTAVDLDAQAVTQAQINARLNGVESVLSIQNSDLLTAVPAGRSKADVVVANLVTDAVLALMPALPQYLRSGGTFIASGIIDERIEEVRQAAEDMNFQWDEERLQHGWYAVKMRRV